VEATLAADPLCLPALAESWFAARAGAGGSGADAAVGGARARDSGPRAGRGRTSGGGAEEVARRRLEAGLRGEVQSWLELACEYSRFGLYGEAYELLLLYRRGVKGGSRAQPMADYHLGYLAEKLGLRDGRRHYREAAAGDPEYVFPHRLESERVLRRAIAVEPRDARARYYLGNLLCARQRPEEAMALWRRAAPALGEFSVVHRNLGRAYWKHREDPDAAIRAYRRALRADPLDYKLYYELNRILLACGLEEERGALVAGIPPSLLDNDVIAELAAAFYVDTGAFDRALQILTATHFYPWEVYKGVRILYVDALIGRGIALMGGAAAGARGRQDLEQALESFRRVLLYPRNIGVGEPFHKANAEALHRMGLALEALGRRAEARRHWEQAAREPRPEPSDLSYYKGRALQKLGRRREASGVFGELLEHARQRLTGRQASAAGDLYLAALAHKGLGNPVQARQELQVALALDRSHRRCRWEANGFGSL
jgi:tetratricopeptide (TPR) repeat protein